jgi:sugar diacid utilization regulator
MQTAEPTGPEAGSPALFRDGGAYPTGLRTVIGELAAVNARLARAVADLERQCSTLDRLIAVAASGMNHTGIAAAVHDLTALPVAVEDQFGNSLAWAGPDSPERRARRQSGRRRAELMAEAGRADGPLRSGDRWIAVARRGDEVLGRLALIDPAGCADRHQLLVLECAAVVLTIELSHQRDLAEAELRLRGDLVVDLITGCHTESAHSRAAALGHDLTGAHQVVVVQWHGSCAEDDVVRAVERAARMCQIEALVALTSTTVVVVAARPPTWGAQNRWSELHRALERVLPGTSVCIGIGALCRSPSELARSYTQALQALAVRQSSHAHGLTSFDDLGVLSLLFTGDDNRDVEQFVQDWLGALIAYDRTKGTDLVSTLSHYYDNAGNYDLTAAALHIHRSTLRYRIKRIRELTGHELGAVDCRLNLQIATRAWQVLQGSS